MRIKMVTFAAMMLCANGASAALVWHAGFTIKSVEYNWNGYREVLVVYVEQTPATNCAVSNTNKVFSYIQSAIDAPLNIRYSALLTAMTANKKIDIQINDAVCDSWVGSRIEGIRINN